MFQNENTTKSSAKMDALPKREMVVAENTWVSKDALKHAGLYYKGMERERPPVYPHSCPLISSRNTRCLSRAIAPK